MLEFFTKYQSLGNDFVLYDWLKKPAYLIDQTLNTSTWPTMVAALCNRHTGIGADGVLVLKEHRSQGCAQMLIFNADGSQAQLCLNGLRCVAHRLVTMHNFPPVFTIETLAGMVECSVGHDEKNKEQLAITTKLSNGNFYGQHTIVIDEKQLNGFIIDVGNPHFIIFSETSTEWLAKHGKSIEEHTLFPHKTNVEFIWPHQTGKNLSYGVLVYERGCGLTQSCSSGAAAITYLLSQQEKIRTNEFITLHMPGGTLTCFIDENNMINVQAFAHKIFDGTLS